jgi:hypothetical protein
LGKLTASGHERKVRKRFFFEKKKQKTFGPAGAGTRAPQPAGSRSFFASFFSKKEALAFSIPRSAGSAAE